MNNLQFQRLEKKTRLTYSDIIKHSLIHELNNHEVISLIKEIMTRILSFEELVFK